MARYEIKQSARFQLTSYAGLALIGQCCQAAQLDAVIDGKIPVSQGMKTSDIVKSMVGLLSMGKIVMDNCGTKKEAVSRTYQGFDGYTPIVAYLGNERWAIGLELRPGSHHSALEAEYFYERIFPRVERIPSGKFDTNVVILHLTAFAYNCLRLLGQFGFANRIAPVRYPAKRRRIKSKKPIRAIEGSALGWRSQNELIACPKDGNSPQFPGRMFPRPGVAGAKRAVGCCKIMRSGRREGADERGHGSGYEKNSI